MRNRSMLGRGEGVKSLVVPQVSVEAVMDVDCSSARQQVSYESHRYAWLLI